MKEIPNILKWRFKKLHKPSFNFSRLYERKVNFPINAQYAIQASESGKLRFKQLESCRKVLRRGLGKSAQIYFAIFTSVPVSKKPVASRMGKGKGSIAFWIGVIRAGKIIVEINNVSSKDIIRILNRAATKLPLKTNILKLYF